MRADPALSLPQLDSEPVELPEQASLLDLSIRVAATDDRGEGIPLGSQHRDRHLDIAMRPEDDLGPWLDRRQSLQRSMVGLEVRPIMDQQHARVRHVRGEEDAISLVPQGDAAGGVTGTVKHLERAI